LNGKLKERQQAMLELRVQKEVLHDLVKKICATR